MHPQKRQIEDAQKKQITIPAQGSTENASTLIECSEKKETPTIRSHKGVSLIPSHWGCFPHRCWLIKLKDDHSMLLKMIMRFQSGDKFEPLLNFLGRFDFQKAIFETVISTSNTQLVCPPLVFCASTDILPG